MAFADINPFGATVWKNSVGVNPDRTNAQNLANRYGLIGGAALGPVGQLGGYLLGRLQGRKLDRQETDQKISDWTAANPMPANMWSNGGVSAYQPSTTPYNNSSAGVSPGAFNDFMGTWNANNKRDTEESDYQITRDTVTGNYTPQGQQSYTNYSSAPQLSGGSDSRGAFSYLTGAAQGTTDVAGVLGSLGDLGANDLAGSRSYVGRDALHQAIREAEASGSKSQLEWASNMRQQLVESRSNGNR